MPSELISCGVGEQSGLDPELVRSQVNRIAASAEFAAAPRLRQFLAFIVEMALSGNAGQIKESLIAVEVYGRRPDYNPQTDSTVRVEANRLRTRLARYYDTSERDAPVCIEVPKGGYVPVFRLQPADPPPIDLNAVAALETHRRTVSPRLAALVAAGLVITAVIWGALWIGGRTSISPAAAVDSIAVLPFVNLSNDAAMERFCDGLTEELTATLARTPGIRVPARSTMFRYRNQSVKLVDVGRKEGVRAVLEGSVRRDGNRFLISSQLIDARTGYHLWAETYERRSSDALGVQQQVAARVGAAVRERARGGTQPIADQPPGPDVLASLQRAYELLRRRIPENAATVVPAHISESVRLFEEITRRSPGFARGWVGLAESSEYSYELDRARPAARLAQARAAARRAVQLNPNLSDAYTVLCSVLFYRDWNLAEAETACRRATELNPRDIHAHRRYADLLRIQGRGGEAQSAIARALAFEPAAPPLRLRRAMLFYDAGEYERAAAEALAVADTYALQGPVLVTALWIQGLCYERQGALARAEELYRKALEHEPHDILNEPALGYLLAATGRTAQAEQIARELEQQVTRGRPQQYALALVHAGLGRQSEALRWLEQGLAQRDPSVLFLGLEKRFERLQSEPRFQALLARVQRRSGYDSL